MPHLVESPVIVEAAGNKPKRIEEFFGKAGTKTSGLSLARMVSPGGWAETGQTPEFDEYTLVLRGLLHVKTREGGFDVGPGQAIWVKKGEWVQYSTPISEGAEYVSVCVPAFSPETVHRDKG